MSRNVTFTSEKHIRDHKHVCQLEKWMLEEHFSKYMHHIICDSLCENPAKVIFFCDLLFSIKNHPTYGKEHSVTILYLYL